MQKHAIASQRIVTPIGIRNGVLLLNGNKIEDLVSELPGEDYIIEDLGDLVLMPGIIDPHVHINEPGRTDWEGFDTATKAALAGGITSLIEMPLNASPVTTTVKAFEEKIKATKGKLHCNCGFWGGVIPGNENEIEPLIEKGVFGFKAFLTHSGIDEFPNVTENDLRKVMPIISKQGLPLLVHCELSAPTIPLPLATRLYPEYLASRPRSWEDTAIALMIRLCEEFNCRTHIVHLSSSNSLEQIAKAKQKGLPLTVETCQHYLYFNAEEIPYGRSEYKCAPPIRERENNLMLHDALRSSLIDFVATDHSPAPPEMKELESGDLMKAWGGISSLQFALPVLWTATQKQGANITNMAHWLCEMPAQLPGLNRKGKIEKGFDADIVAWDPEARFTVTKDMIQHRHKITPYLGEELKGVVKHTWVAGKKLFHSGKFLHLEGGELLMREKEHKEHKV
jgi:allantoinase